MIAVSVDTGRLPEQLQRLGDVARRRFWQDYAPSAEVILIREQRRHFEEQKGPDGTPWKPSKRALQQKGQTLEDTGRLRASVTGGGAGAVRQTGPNYITFGTRLHYARIHQFGGDIDRSGRRQTLILRQIKNGQYRFASRKWAQARKRGAMRFAVVDLSGGKIKIPARPYLGVSARGRDELRKMAQVKLSKMLKDAAR